MRDISFFVVFCMTLLLGVLPLFAGPNQETLSVFLYNWDGTPANSLQFPVEDATVDEPWVYSPQYIRIIHSSDETIWGVRIVTKNNITFGQVYPKPISKGPDNQWEWEKLGESSYPYVNGNWQTGDDSVSFAGLIDNATKLDPNKRASLAWQVFVNPVSSPDPIYKNWQGVWNVGGNWNDDWVYVVDKNDKWNGVDSVNGVFEPGTWNAKYDMIAVGTPLSNNLTQHPVVAGSQASPDPKYGDGDIAVYLAACFGVMNGNSCTGLLPAGQYSAVLYVELVHE